MNRELIEGRLSHGATPFGGAELRAESSPTDVARSLSSIAQTTHSGVIVPRYFPFFWYGPNSVAGPFANCANAMYYPGLVSAGVANPALPAGCFGGGFLNSTYDSPAQLVPGQNKNALYGPAYNPNVNSIQ